MLWDAPQVQISPHLIKSQLDWKVQMMMNSLVVVWNHRVIFSEEIQSDYLKPLHKPVQITAVFVFIPAGWRTGGTALHLPHIKDVSVETVTASKCDCDKIHI